MAVNTAYETQAIASWTKYLRIVEREYVKNCKLLYCQGFIVLMLSI